jgi:hypothetical protein
MSTESELELLLEPELASESAMADAQGVSLLLQTGGAQLMLLQNFSQWCRLERPDWLQFPHAQVEVRHTMGTATCPINSRRDDLSGWTEAWLGTRAAACFFLLEPILLWC